MAQNYSKREGRISRGKPLRRCGGERDPSKLRKPKGVQFEGTAGICIYNK